jgi:catechol 2,3-dioxygenase-like lactoylglutathione lyase family enzyme
VSDARAGADDFYFADLIPELMTSDVAESIAFYRMLGFEVAYERPEEGFAFMHRGAVQIMLERITTDYHTAPMEKPFGRGTHFQIAVDSLAPIVSALAGRGWPLQAGPEERWYRVRDSEEGQRQIWLRDPDGYLLRFAESLGRRPARAPA